jgi:hypothetical protein
MANFDSTSLSRPVVSGPLPLYPFPAVVLSLGNDGITGTGKSNHPPITLNKLNSSNFKHQTNAVNFISKQRVNRR